ncbi:5'-nucleotidase C-terminal domain-containing protein [Streptomyces sp. NBC_00536]|uniref:bifunctional metallophosphatase/5'-nucleotidase n=1 Tax=Streptomyces sp. NBC_00536 TaxID=2975769 RepID=UPI002E81D2EF|nr:5'-nucleotidase C-terminal domain-containing protein [Streptomyces sp. NBC_00536]WUC81048.1 5'-nucleotidase C-terminal domain-containing protein [Streptomyces sp. NBC_00536]
MKPPLRFALLALATATAATAAASGLVPASAAEPLWQSPHGQDVVDIQVLNVSDFHGQLDPLNIRGVGNVGGAAALSTYWKADRKANPDTLLMSAGDTVGASVPVSGFFDDEPTVKFMNQTGFSANTFGNHNFDKGLAHLQSQIDAADFPYVSANLTNLNRNLHDVSPYTIKTVHGVKVAIIGVTNPEAPTLVAPGNFGSMKVTDPAKAAMRAREEAARHGAKVFIALGHLGIEGTDAQGGPTGPLTEFAHAVHGFDLVLGDHTDVQYKSEINGALVLENLSKGATYAKTTLKYDRRRGGHVVAAASEFVVPLSDKVTPDPEVVAMLKPYRDELSKRYDGKIAVATGLFDQSGEVDRVRETALGDLTTDALRTTYGTQIAFTNGGGIRASLPSTYQPADKTLRRTGSGPYDLVAGDAYAVLPFGNQSLTRTVTGTQLWAVLEQSVSKAPNSSGGFLQVSGFRFTYDSAKPVGSRVLSVTLDGGTPIARDATTYTAATNNFTNAGGDGYTMLADGQGTTRNLMAGDLLTYLTAQKTVTPTTHTRIDDTSRPDA